MVRGLSCGDRGGNVGADVDAVPGAAVPIVSAVGVPGRDRAPGNAATVLLCPDTRPGDRAEGAPAICRGGGGGGGPDRCCCRDECGVGVAPVSPLPVGGAVAVTIEGGR